MKKQSSTKLRLTKTVVANLNPDKLEQIAGARAAYTKASVCMEQCCVTDYCW